MVSPLRAAKERMTAAAALIESREVETAVIGSGPGGAITAAVLAESGREVLLIEEGGRLSQGEFAPFGIDEMRAAYRKRGMTAALGAPPINYVEGRCLGGGSEINSGLYHRPPTAALRRWKELGADDSRIVEMCEMNERDLGVTLAPGETQPASELLAEGARALGWSCAQTPRWHRYDSGYRPLAPGGARQSMSETFLPRFAAAGGRVVDDCEARRLRRTSGGWRIDALMGGRETSIFARAIFVACGATRTPALLRRSGIKKGVGESLRMHVFTRVVAEFDRPINARGAGVGPHQIDCFAPRLRLGCAVSSPEHVALALAQSDPRWLRDHDEKWPCRAAYYATVGGGRGVVRALAGGGEVVFYRLRCDDYYDLADGARALARVLFAAGARRVLPIMACAPTIESPAELWKLPRPLPPARARLTSVHLMASCPIGGAVDSFGRVKGERGLHIADSSLFCDSPNVNPQGAVMALARRNALVFCEKKEEK